MKNPLLPLSQEAMVEHVVEYVAGKYDNDPDMKLAVEDMIIDSPEAQTFYKDYTGVLNSKTDQEWKDDAEKSLKAIKARLRFS